MVEVQQEMLLFLQKEEALMSLLDKAGVKCCQGEILGAVDLQEPANLVKSIMSSFVFLVLAGWLVQQVVASAPHSQEVHRLKKTHSFISSTSSWTKVKISPLLIDPPTPLVVFNSYCCLSCAFSQRNCCMLLLLELH